MRSRKLHHVVAGLMVATALTAVTGRAAAAPGAAAGLSTSQAAEVTLPHDDPFYRYDGRRPLKDIKPGTVLKHRTVTLGLFGQGSTPVEAEQLLYRTQDESRDPSVTVTTVIEPAGASTGLVAYLSFYDALGDSCDPSYTLQGGVPADSSSSQNADLEEGLVASLLAQGYAVTVPDFEGTDHHWVAGHESGWSTLDSVRATQSFLGMDRASTPVGLIGYSGGSIAGEWAAELAPRYAPGLNLVGAALGGLPVHLAHNLRYVNGSDTWSGVIPAVMVSLSRAFGIDTDKYASRYGRKVMREVSDQCIASFLGNYPGLKAAKLLKKRYRPFLSVRPFARVVNHLIMGTAPGTPRIPLFLGVGDADGTGDDVMVAGDVEALGHEYCQQGVTVEFTRYQGLNHEEAALPFFPAAFTFLAGRMAGLPFAGNCDSIGEGNSLDPIPVR